MVEWAVWERDLRRESVLYHSSRRRRSTDRMIEFVCQLFGCVEDRRDDNENNVYLNQ